MALEVKYGEIRTNVIKGLQNEFDEMVRIYGQMNDAVNGIVENNYMLGESAGNYVLEFTDPISKMFERLNENIQNYCAQLNSICDEFERQDAEMANMLNVGE